MQYLLTDINHAADTNDGYIENVRKAIRLVDEYRNVGFVQVIDERGHISVQRAVKL